MLSEKTIKYVKQTVPVLENAGVSITEHFYKRMFTAHPELQNIFNLSNQKSGRQQFALFSAVASYAKHIDNLEALSELIERVANKHSSYFIQKEHYPIVGFHLIETLKELAPDSFTPEVSAAWEEAYNFLASILYNRESDLYEEKSNQSGGWRGPREFIVERKIMESELVYSFILTPRDKKVVVHHQAGQYLGIKLQPTPMGFEEIRQYSISDKANGQTYRISVKKELEPQRGLVSNYLHEHIQEGDILTLYPPAGDFYLKAINKPNVLISAGVGITPMISMLETLAAFDFKAPTWFLHACHNADQHSFKARVKELDRQFENLHSETWYKTTENFEPHTHLGYMDLFSLASSLPLVNGDFYICGPVEFMANVKKQLLFLDVSPQQIHYELFGPHKDL